MTTHAQWCMAHICRGINKHLQYRVVGGVADDLVALVTFVCQNVFTVILHGHVLTARVHDFFLLFATGAAVKALVFVRVGGILPIISAAGHRGFEVEQSVASAKTHHHACKQLHL